MTAYLPFTSPRLRVGLLMWLLGMVGTVVVTVEELPRLLEGHAIPIPTWLLTMISIGQSGILLGLAVWAGVALAPAVGLHARAFEATVTARPVAPALVPQLLPGLIAGAFGGGLLLAIIRYTPPALAVWQERFAPSLLGSLLYGGITEELLMRWGFMTTLLWLVWRFVHRRRRAPGLTAVFLCIVASAVVFGAGHLPAVAALIGHLSADVAFFVVTANALFGILCGWLFWRFGLESAMIAHATTHLFSYVFKHL